MMLAIFGGVGELYAQESPKIGQQIVNQVSGTYVDNGGTEVGLVSNEVKVIVDGAVDPIFDFYPNNSIVEFRGRTVELTHFIRNSGNVTSTVDVKGFNTEGDNFDLQDLSWTTQGLVQAKAVLNTDTLTTSVTLAPGEEFEVSYIGTISLNEERETLTSLMVFEATARETGQTIQNIDSISIRVGAIVEIVKDQIGTENLTQGDSFTYKIAGENIGDMTAFPRDITVDGAIQEQVILHDSIPANLSFVSFGSVDKGTPLYHVIGADKYEFTSTAPADINLVDVIGVSFDSLQVGESFEFFFDVRVNDNATGEIINIAELSYVDPEGSVTTAAASNDVVTTLPGELAAIDYYTDQNFDEETGTSSIGQALNIQSNAPVCNENRGLVEEVKIKIKSQLTFDEENYIGIETGANTGVFRILEEVPTRDGSTFSVIIDNKILETVEDDIIEAILDCNGLSGGTGTSIMAEVIVDPFGVVFDSETNRVIPGAEVVLIDVTGANNGGNPGSEAIVYQANGRDPFTNEQLSSTQGKYKYPFLRAGTYRIEVVPPKGYSFSSEVPFDSLPGDRNVNQLASYGADFEVTGAPVGLDFDIPLDPLALGVLFADKNVDRQVAEIGDYVNYTITIKSEAVNTVENLSVFDKLPFGFEYQLGSARLDGIELADPIGGAGPDLEFSIGDIDPGATKVISYRVYLGPGSERSDGINTALVQSDELVVKTSNNAKVKIEVRGGVFNDEALIIGKVFMDCDENNLQNGAELGIPGVRLYLENGNYVITDSEGKYSFYAITPNKHVLKLDNYSLPVGSKMKVLDNRHAFDPSSRFVDVKKGELHRADFAVCECSPGIIEEIKRRADLLNGASKNSLTSSLKQSFSLQDKSGGLGGNSTRATGTVGNQKEITIAQETPGKNTEETNLITEATQEKVIEENKSIEDLIVGANSEVGFLNIADNDTIRSEKLTIWTKGSLGAIFDLFVNDELVGMERIGQRSSIQDRKIQVWEYVSVDLKPGVNTIEVVEGDPFGNVRGSKKVTVVTPGTLETVRIIPLRKEVPADGVSTALLKIQLVDESGMLIGSRMPVTLDASRGNWKVLDLDAQEPGTQVFIENGEAEFELLSIIEPSSSKVRASVGVITETAKVEFLPDLRPMIAAGILEGSLRLREPLNIQSDVDNDGFERELKQLSYSMNNFTADGRFAFFLKGKVSGRTLLTAGFDSEKDKEERLFRDIRPDEFYPVYGESSVKGFDAQSSGRLYIRLDRNKTYALYGDFITQENSSDVQLGAYNRAQNGIKTHLEQGALQVEAFGVSSVSSRRIREFQGQGISRYELPDDEIIDNSDIVELITYDRNQSEVILSKERLTRFTDYVIDPFSGVITFKSPVFSVDQEFNPVFIRTTYEVANTSERYLIGGVSGDLELTKGVNVGAGVVQDNNPDGNFTMATSKFKVELNNSTRIVAEAVRTITDTEGTGNAGRIEVQQKGKIYELNAQVGRSDANYNNEGSSLGQSRTEAKARGRLNLTQRTDLNAEFILSRNDTTGDQTLGSLVGLKHSFQGGVNAEVGIRYTEQTNSSSSDVTNTNLRTKVTSRVPFVKGASAFGEYEQDLNAADRKTIAVGGDYKIRNIAKAYVKHELTSSAAGRYTLQSNAQKNNTIFGLDANYMKNGKVFSEYRMNDALDGRTGQASLGLRNKFVIKEGLGLNVGFERTFTVQGPSTNDGTSISAAVDYTGSENWKGSARAEARFGANTNTYLNTLGYGLKINRDWTLLGRNILALSNAAGTSTITKLQERFQLGAAYRDTETNMFDALFRYEFKHEKNLSIAPDFFRSAHVLSSHANYHPTQDLVLSGRLASKYSVESDDQVKVSSFLELVSGRVIYDLNDRWDVGVNASLLANSDFTTKDYGVGVEAGYIVARNLRLAAGFNFFGYEDEDLAANNYTQPGAYLGFSYKFDEQVFRNLIPNRANNFLDESVYLTCVPCDIPLSMSTIPVEVPSHKLDPVVVTAKEFDYKPIAKYVLLPRQIHFDNDMSYINQSTAQMLDKVAKFLMTEDDYVINLSGFTDAKATDGYNLALSDRRSKAARAYLVSAGVEDRKLLIDKFGETTATAEDMIEMALERKVEMDLTNVSRRVQFVDQVEDLQVQQKAAKIGGWDYIFKSEHNAVPLNLNIAEGSTELNYLNKYILERVAMALREYPDISVRISLPADDRFSVLQNSILNEFNSYGTDIMRFMFVRGTTSDAKTIRFDYINGDHLAFFEQQDDIKFRNNKAVPALLESLLRVLNSREDYQLIHDLSQSYVVPDRVNFASRSSILDNETQAVLSRIGSYLRNNESVFLELIGDGSAIEAKRMIAMQEYLINWGIDAARITSSRATTETGGRSIRIEYRNADSINLRNIEFLNKPRGKQ